MLWKKQPVGSKIADLNSNIFKFAGVKAWIENADLNDYKTSGYYPISTGPSNAPNNSAWGILEVVGTRDDTTEQIYSVSGKKYTREYRSGAWSAWKELGFNDTIVMYTIQYAASASQSGNVYNSPSISAAIDLIAAKGTGRYFVQCINSSSYSDTYNSILSGNTTLIMDVMSTSWVNILAMKVAGPETLRRAKTSSGWGNWELLALNSKTDMVTKYLNDTSKTGLALVTADFSSLGVRETRFYSVRPSDDNLFGFFTRYSENYGSGIFTTYMNNKTYHIQNSNGTWTKEEIALNSSIPKYLISNANTSSVSPNTNSSVTVPVPTGATSVLAIIPIGFVPADHWNSTIVFTNVNGRVISFRCVGSGNAQVFAARYCAIYI